MSILSATNFSVPPGLKGVGDYLGRLGKFGHHCWDIKGSVRDLYLAEIRPAILTHLDRRIPSQSSIIITAYMIGRRASSAVPTILFVSEDPRGRKEARKVTQDSGILSPYRGWKTAQASKDPSWGGELEQLASGRSASNTDRLLQDPATRVLYDPAHPITPQGMTLYVDMDSEVRTFTASLIRIKGSPMFLGPAHAFFTKSAEQASSPVNADDDFEIDSDDDTDTIWAEDELSNFTELEFEAESSSDESESLADYNDYDTFSESSTDSFGDEITVEPIPRGNKLNDAEAKIRHPQIEIEAPPLETLEPFGVLRRWSTDKDWALVEVQGENDELISRFCDAAYEDISTMKTARPDLPGAAVITQTASAGILAGTMCATISDMRVPNGETFQKVFSIKLGGTLADGDCGSLVVDAITGELYGHVIAGCRSTGFAYVMAASHTLPDILGSLSKQKEDDTPERADFLTFGSVDPPSQPVNGYTTPWIFPGSVAGFDFANEAVYSNGTTVAPPTTLADLYLICPQSPTLERHGFLPPLLHGMDTVREVAQYSPPVTESRESIGACPYSWDPNRPSHSDTIVSSYDSLSQRSGLEFGAMSPLQRFPFPYATRSWMTPLEPYYSPVSFSTADPSGSRTVSGRDRAFTEAYSRGNLRRRTRGKYCPVHSSWTCALSSDVSHVRHMKPHRPYHDHHTDHPVWFRTDHDYCDCGACTDDDYCMDHGGDDADCRQCIHRAGYPDHAHSIDQDESIHHGHSFHQGHHTDQDNPPEHDCHREDDPMQQQCDHSHCPIELSTSPHDPRMLELCRRHSHVVGESDIHDAESPPSAACTAKHRHCSSG